MDPWNAFTAAEAEIHAMVHDPRWRELPDNARAHAIAARTLVTREGDRWLFGAHARWHLLDPADGRWHLAPPPRRVRVRRVGHSPAALPRSVIPRGPDFAGEPGSTQAFVGPDVPPRLCAHISDLLRANCLRSETDHPLSAFDDVFAADVPSTVAAIWGTIMWCAYAPAFDGNERLITMFGEFLRRPLPGDEWVRWLPAPRLADLARLVAERHRAGHERVSLRLTALIADTAHLLLSDTRFRPRALALLTMVEPALKRPGLDDEAAGRGDHALRRAWLRRCPPRLARALMAETDPESDLSHAVYELVEALAFTPDPPRAAAAYLADLSDSKGSLPPRLDHRLRHAYEELVRAGLTSTSAAERTEPDGFPVRLSPAHYGHYPDTGSFTGPGGGPDTRTGGIPEPGRPDSGHTSGTTSEGAARRRLRLPGITLLDRRGGFTHVREEAGTGLMPPDRDSTAAVLGAAYAVGLAWHRVSGARVPERGFAGSAALVRRLISERDDPGSPR
ncbi:hypothetical protein OUY22_10215 [Nonomuraea sp. MCN248]|uniref:Uncharacterized protein n=1 Tax=Nonomuraea corallina TaxID=2989783 RepID=A0ABT4S9A2_9ACTN|nr:hypothetical protein [Nonomuraea corallina]MDA0633793.1 hypothetical protein [Nonomuraea corallina]